ncbi:hypothetical protein [Leifsonia aquatica]|uniref:hypothetical protein n=1 Tax=Leifsonia aquatica TaxID=144185 RepID=UPI0004694641|nr:hypothetical protein [Leifsonia aquatica]
MLRFIFAGVARTYYFLARYAPGPRLISRIRRRNGLKWGVPAMLVAAPYFLVANLLQTLIEGGGSAWLSLPLLWCLIMGMAFILLGPISVVLLIIARTRETVESRHVSSGR